MPPRPPRKCNVNVEKQKARRVAGLLRRRRRVRRSVRSAPRHTETEQAQAEQREGAGFRNARRTFANDQVRISNNKVVVLSEMEKSSIRKETIESSADDAATRKHAGGTLYNVVGIPWVWVTASERV